MQQKWLRKIDAFFCQYLDCRSFLDFSEFGVKGIVHHLPPRLRLVVSGEFAKLAERQSGHTGDSLGVAQMLQYPALKKRARPGSRTIRIWITQGTANRQNIMAGHRRAVLRQMSRVGCIGMIAD